ncbi:hypothetical protein IYQ92_05345 [Streptococcus sp. HF-1907]|uniref:hypothetical protein n=1 Tax=Streptococcus sp. HF-1907 TaxID=2785793 RepID=UPI00189D88CC|nr:hypothetical protein [Streptococcus sp. HF-1907]MBF7094675.1 hypothetical protein [Streptococcus sp. HF-1907]
MLKSYRTLGDYLAIRAATINDTIAIDLLTPYNAGRKYMADKIARQAGSKSAKAATKAEENSKD